MFDLDVVQKYIILFLDAQKKFSFIIFVITKTTAAEVDGKTQKYYVDKSNVTRL